MTVVDRAVIPRANLVFIEPGAKGPRDEGQYPVGHDGRQDEGRDQHTKHECEIAESRHKTQQPREQEIDGKESDPNAHRLLPSGRWRRDDLLNRAGLLGG